MLMPSWKACTIRLSRRIRHTQNRHKVTIGELTDLRDVKNEGTTGDVYENTRSSDKMTAENSDIYGN